MGKKILVLFLASVFLSGCSLSPKKSALEITSYPVAKVYINGKDSGVTPYKSSDLKPGSVQVTLVSQDKQWSKKIKLQNNVNTVIDLEMGTNDKETGGYILYLEKTGDNKKASAIINSNPDKSTISIDEEIKGLTPLRLGDIGDGDKHLVLTNPGYKKVEIFMKAIKGYQLVVDVDMVKEEKKDTEIVDNQDNQLSSQPEKKLKIKETETGWLRVREKASTAGKEVAKVNSGDEYKWIEEDGSWIKIDLGGDKSGWVKSTYVEKIE